ncbi:chromosome segregation protein SMC [bacterium]|nr:chromosome segregation protein SMC [candidate division CSSED10-310 bacterium]
MLEESAAQQPENPSKPAAIQFQRLVLHGFKSFPDRTVFEFGHPICAIVGPNGCGKSNVLDALRWVMGEQGPSQLRAQSMSDVIFNGSAQRKPLGMAEVCLTIQCAGVELPYQFDEIEIARRLYRSGESEYLINKSQCRLKDIVDLFLDMKIGKGAYSLIEQGRVDALLMARPEERRGLLEQAAGILKYKSRKKEALSKLASTERNLERVRDVIAEVKSRRIVLARQARRAEQYHRLKNELEDLQGLISTARFARLKKALAEENSRIDRLNSAIARSTARIGLRDASVQEAKSRVDTAAESLASARRDVEKSEYRIENLEEKLRENDGRMTELQAESRASAREIEALENRNRTIQNTRNEIMKSCEETGRSIDRDTRDHTQNEEKIRRMDEQISAIRQSVRELKETQLALIERASLERNRRAKTEEAARRVQSRFDGLNRESEDLAGEENGCRMDLNRAETRLNEVSCKLTEAVRELEDLQAEIVEKIRKSDEIQGGIREIESQYMETKSRLDSLEEVVRTGEGLGEGVRAILNDYRNQSGVNGDIVGLLADLFETEPRYEKAVVAALEMRIQDVVVTAHSGTPKAIRYLSTEQKGRCTFTPMKLKAINGHPSPTHLPDTARPLFDLIRTQDEMIPLFKQLLVNTYLVDDLGMALRTWSEEPIPVTLVTVEGEVVGPEGSVTGGSNLALDSGYRSRKREISRLRREVGRLSVRRTELNGIREELSGFLREKTERRTELEREKSVLEVELAEIRKDRDHFAERLRRVKLRKSAVETEGNLMLEELKELETELSVLAETDRKSGEEAGAADEIRNRETRMDTLTVELEEVRISAAEVRIRLERAKERLGADQRQIAALGDESERIDGMVRDLQTRIAQLNEQQQQLSARTAEIKRDLKELADQRPNQELRLRNMQSRLDREKTACGELEMELNQLRLELQSFEREINERKIEIARLETAMQSLENGSGIDLKARSKEIDPLPDEAEISDWCRQTEKLETDLNALGDVNLAAVAEHREIVERSRYLEEQMTDLEDSIRSLKTTITQINQVSKTRFLDAFREVNRYFSDTFRVLFDGGEAALRLQDPDNPLETGIDIVCRPPGKRARNIDLLSGGEKALAALALLFAGFIYQPAPIMFLDEVDASLDEANIARFTGFLKEISRTTQLVMISHNPRTMESADALYGITMPEPGISKLMTAKVSER